MTGDAEESKGNVPETGSEYENEDDAGTGEEADIRDVLEMDDYETVPLNEPVSKLDEELMIPETPLATEDNECDEDEYGEHFETTYIHQCSPCLFTISFMR